MRDLTHNSWFAGPKGENGEWVAQLVGRVLANYYGWRRHHVPDDGALYSTNIDTLNEFQCNLERLLGELLERLQSDVPFQSPRYAAHMVAEQTIPSIAGYFATMLYNPNNITDEVAPVTVQLELEAAQMISTMLGYGENSWSHLTGGGTVANFEALWIARTVKYLPFVVRDMRKALRLSSIGDLSDALLGVDPSVALSAFQAVFAEAESVEDAVQAYRDSDHNVVGRGLASVVELLRSSPVILVPETHHYCFEKAVDILGIGRDRLINVPVDSDFRMDVTALSETIERCEDYGQHILAVVAVVGSTEEGAIDPVNQILELRSKRTLEGKSSFWLHIDAAYGGYLRTLTNPVRIGLGPKTSVVKIGGEVQEIQLHLPEHSACEALERLGEADSITIDPHKLGYVPYPAGAICFRSNTVKPLARQEAAYISDGYGSVEEEQTSAGIGVFTLEGSRPGATAAAVWLSHKLIPLDNEGHGLLVQETVRNACELHALLEQYPKRCRVTSVRAECLCPPGSNILCYAFRPNEAISLKRINALNEAIYKEFSIDPRAGRFEAESQFYVSRTRLSVRQYGASTISDFLARVGVSREEYEEQGIFLLRSVLMNPWYERAKETGRYYLSEMVEALFSTADRIVGCDSD